MTSHGVAVRPKITTHLRAQASASPEGVSSPKYTRLLGIRLDVFESQRTKKKKKKTRHFFLALRVIQTGLGVTAFLSVALVITAALTRDRQERVCVCLRQRCPAEEYLSFFFIYSAACCSFSLRYGELGQSRVKISAKRRGRRLLTWRARPFDLPCGGKYTVPAASVVSFSARELISPRSLTLFVVVAAL